MIAAHQLGNVNRQNITQAESRVNTLNNIIKHFYETQGLHDPIKSKKVNACLLSLREAFIRKSLPISATMNYGSAASGFGSINSDLDVTIQVSSNYELKDPKDILRKVAQILLECDGNCDAKFQDNRVPIVTTFFKGFDMDICYNGQDAVQDAKLFKAYGNWDNRVFPLGYIVKKWAKQYGICGGSRGYFRSYHWIILTISFLQKKEVVPYIQSEFCTNDSADWRSYRIEVVRKWSSNDSSVAELFLDFLEYYGKFNFKKEVIYIRSQEPSHRTNDEISKPVCIRNPFYCETAVFNRLSKEQKEDYRKNGPEQANVAGEIIQKRVDTIQKHMTKSAMMIRSYLQGHPITDGNMKGVFAMGKGSKKGF